MLLSMAVRNLIRHRRRTALTGSAVIFSTAVLVFFTSIQLKSYELGLSAAVSLFQGHGQLQRAGFNEDPSIEDSFVLGQSELLGLASNPSVVTTARRGLAGALLSSTTRTYAVQIAGVEPEKEGALSTIPSRVVEGLYFPKEVRGEVVIGKTLSRRLSVTVGDELTLLGQGKDGSVAASVLKVGGVFESGSIEMDRSLAEIHLDEFQEIFTMGDEYHSIVLKTSLLSDSEEIIKGLDRALRTSQPSVRALSWDDLSPGLKESMQLDFAVSWIFYCCLIAIVAFSLVNTFLMSVLERTREFGIMLALGSRPVFLSKIIVTEGIILCATGVALGISGGIALILYFNRVGFSVPGADEVLKLWSIPSVIRPEVTLPVVSLAPSIILVASLSALIYPAWKAARTNPLDAIRKG